MGHSTATQDEAFEATTRSVGCVAALLPRISLKAVAKWFRQEEQAALNSKQAVLNSKAERSARYAPCVVETDSTLSDLLDSRSNAASAHREKQAAANRASIDAEVLAGGVFAPVQRKARAPKRARSEKEIWLWGPPPWQM